MSAVSNYCAQNPKRLNRIGQSLLGAVFALAGFQAVADTHTYQAISDFEDIAAGEVPYYVDTGGNRNVLAIDAAVVEYREKFARATTIFAGNSGTYDVTITALGEIDGEGEFRFLVNGDVVGSAVNELVDEDWGEQLHVIENIEIASGDEISVESDAQSNGLIPENGEYAFARGRWRELTLVSDDAATANPVSINLSVALAVEPEEAELGDLVAAVVSVTNSGADTATNPVLQVTAGAGLQFVSGEGCTVEAAGEVITCALEELAPTSAAVSGLAFLASATGATNITVEVAADQTDTEPSDNAASADLQVISGDNLETVATAVTTGANTIASTATDAINEELEQGQEQGQESAPSESAAATGSSSSSSSGGSGRTSVILLLVLFGLSWRLALRRV